MYKRFQSPLSYKAGKLGNPKITRSEAFEGLNLITWQPVIDAVGYHVYRYDPDLKFTKDLGDTGGNLYLLDWVSWTNQLQDNKKYEYTIVAVSSQSTSQPSIDGSLPLQNGSSKTTITAKIPAAFTPADPTFDIEQQDKEILVKITDTKPNLNYQVGYTFGEHEVVRTFARPSQDVSGNWFDPVKTARFFVIGGKNSVTVWSVFGSDYYASGKSQLTKATGDLPLGGLYVKDFTADRKGQADPLVNFTWESNGVEFEIYKAELDDDWTAENWANYPGNGHPSYPITGNPPIVVKSDWTPVTITDPDNGGDGVNWTAEETVSSVLGNYIYGIIAKDEDGTAISDVAFSAITDDDSLETATNFAVEYKHGTYGNGTTIALITWELGAGTAGGTYKLTENGEDITPSTGYIEASYPLGYVVVERPLANDKTYKYVLTIYKGGTSNSTDELEIDGWTSPVFEITGVSASTGNSYIKGKKAASISLDLDFTSADGKADKDYTITLKRRVVGKTNNSIIVATYDKYSSVYADVTIPTAEQKFAKDATSWSFNDATLPASYNDLNNIYAYALYVDGELIGEFGEIKDTRPEDYFRPLGWDAVNSLSAVVVARDTAIPADDNYGTLAPAVGKYSIVVASGITTVYADGTPTDYSGILNIDGVPVKVEYEDLDEVERGPIDLTITAVSSKTVDNGGTGDAKILKTVTYYILTGVPGHDTNTSGNYFDWNGNSDDNPSLDLTITFPWSTTPITITP